MSESDTKTSAQHGSSHRRWYSFIKASVQYGSGRRFRWYSFETIISVMNSIGTAWVFVLLVIINLDIGGRAIFNHPIRGVPEIVAMSIVACVFLQIAHTLRVGRLTRSDLLMNWLKDKSPGLKSFLEGLYYSIGAALMAIFPSQSWSIWLGTAVMGLSLAAIFPTTFSFVGGKTQLSGKQNGLVWAAGSLGAMTLPWTIGRTFDHQGSLSMMSILLIVWTLALGLFFVITRTESEAESLH